MPNMSYCRFENTSNDIKDCMDALEEHDWDIESLMASASSEYEKRGMKRFIKLCREIGEAFEDIDI